MSKNKCQEITPVTCQSENGSESNLKSSKKDDVEVMKMRSPMHLPLTPLGTPEKSVPRSAETFHKTTLSGRTVDIMILPRTANDDNEKKDDSEMIESELPKCTSQGQKQEMSEAILNPRDEPTNYEGRKS
ncbi:unnamed protein product [Cylicocyclus nassatus]|uniref:Uncharacterized protein n=1 Tax=Cylicocyclus nassatus TaxID=53992 RepID=A0AA36GNR5_CYLNA|nr:unnamed protein product [Cylicocyclus nassatus]